MKSRGLATIAAAAALATGALAGTAAATTHDQGGGQRNCTRSAATRWASSSRSPRAKRPSFSTESSVLRLSLIHI